MAIPLVRSLKPHRGLCRFLSSTSRNWKKNLFGTTLLSSTNFWTRCWTSATRKRPKAKSCKSQLLRIVYLPRDLFEDTKRARYITQESHKLEIQARPPAAVTNAVSWRSEGIRYRKNEVFLDVIESVNLLVITLSFWCSFSNTAFTLYRSTLAEMSSVLKYLVQ